MRSFYREYYADSVFDCCASEGSTENKKLDKIVIYRIHRPECIGFGV